jgi:hypothetical protein
MVDEPYVKHVECPVWEMRMRGKDGIARAAYVTAVSYTHLTLPTT